MLLARRQSRVFKWGQVLEVSQGLLLQEGRHWLCIGSITTGDRYQASHSFVSPGSAGVSTARAWRRKAFTVVRQLYKAMWAHLTWPGGRGWMWQSPCSSLRELLKKETNKATNPLLYFLFFFFLCLFFPSNICGFTWTNYSNGRYARKTNFDFQFKTLKIYADFIFWNFRFKKPFWFCPIMFSSNWYILDKQESVFFVWLYVKFRGWKKGGEKKLAIQILHWHLF